jgi:hypothetical protein
LLWAIFAIPGINKKQKTLITLIMLMELVICLRNNQSNGIIAALMIFTFNAFEDERPVSASLLLALSIYIKLFTIVGLAFMLLYQARFKFILFFLTWFILIGMLPLILIPFDNMSSLYESWFTLLGRDYSDYYGISVSGWLYTWFGLMIPKNIVAIAGMIILLLPFFALRNYRFIDFRLKILASILLWMVIFNHMAESPTYIIAMTGVGIWFFSGRFNWLNFSLLILALFFTSFTMTDFFPKDLLNTYVKPYVLKAVPCIIIWIKLTIELIFFDRILRNEEPVLAVGTAP